MQQKINVGDRVFASQDLKDGAGQIVGKGTPGIVLGDNFVSPIVKFQDKNLPWTVARSHVQTDFELLLSVTEQMYKSLLGARNALNFSVRELDPYPVQRVVEPIAKEAVGVIDASLTAFLDWRKTSGS